MKYLAGCSAFGASLVGLGLIVGGARAEDQYVRFALADEILQYLNAPGHERSNESTTPNGPPKRVYAPARKQVATPPKPPPPPAAQTETTSPLPHTASQQEWDECAGKDPARVIEACSRIVPNVEETVQNRADAYLFRAGAYLAQGDFDRAIADYSDAIVLTPRNVVAYSSRALAYSRKGDRTHAVTDYVTAAKIDPQAVAGIAAGNAEIDAIAKAAQ
jgi:tetratricopeptide (TPR) repeat protein